MNAISSFTSNASPALINAQTPAGNEPPKDATYEAFQGFVGETFYGMMLKALRETSDEVAYLDGGQAEEMFRNQLDQTVAASLAESHGEVLAKPLYDRFRGQLDISV